MKTLREKYEVQLKAQWIKANGLITEARLANAKPRVLSFGQMLLPQSFNLSRVRIFWPSSYPWPLTHKWLFPLLSEFRRNFDIVFQPMPVFEHAIYFEVEIDGVKYPIAIDAFDKVEVNEHCANQVMIYFKMQYATEGYVIDNILPGGFIPAYSNIYLHLDKARKIRDRQDFSCDAYGRFGGRFAKNIRGQAVEKLSSQSRFAYHGGIGRVSYKDSLLEIARSKVCVDLPGYGPLCFRLIDYLAVGACIIAYPHQAKLPIPLKPGKEIIYCKEDLSDLNDLCEYYIHHSEEREAISQAARNYFDTYLARPRLASYYINTILQFVRGEDRLIQVEQEEATIRPTVALVPRQA